MKKIIILFLGFAMLLICSTGCANPKVPENETITKPLLETSDSSTYELLNKLVQQDYAKIKIDIVTTTEFAKLYSNYVLTKNSVVYSVEKLNLLPTDGNFADLPSNYKTTATGYALIENGHVVELDGNQDIVLPAYNELKGNFNFDKDNFKNVVVDVNSFKAEVLSASRFYGADVDLNNLTVSVEYSKTTLLKITLSYQLASSLVQTVYTFEK